MTPALMKMPTMKKMVMLMTLILVAHKPTTATGREDQGNLQGQPKLDLPINQNPGQTQCHEEDPED